MLTITPTGIDVTDLVVDSTEASLDAAATLWLINNDVVDTVDDDPTAQQRFEDRMLVLDPNDIAERVANGKTLPRH